MMLAQETAKNLKVVLTGEGSDEIFGGYPWYRFDRLSRMFSWMPEVVKRIALLGPVLPRVKPWASQVFLAKRPITLRSYADLISSQYPHIPDNILSPELISRVNSDPAIHEGYDKIRGMHPFERIQYLEIKTRLIDWTTHGLDRMSMAHSLEARVPFLDHEFVELAIQVPPALKMRVLREKYIFKKAMKNDLPREIIKRKKFGLRAPCAKWLRDPLPEFAEEMFSKSCTMNGRYFNYDSLSVMLKDHKKGKKNFTKPLMVVLGVHLWHKYFVEGCK
jgi:asparagine synthase (glutamine-hydrolysing)